MMRMKIGRMKIRRKDKNGKEGLSCEGRIKMARMKIGRKDEDDKEGWI